MPSKKILDYFEKTNAGYLHAHGEASTEILLSKLEIKPQEHILEIGFGTGATLVKIASRFPDINLYGIERSLKMFANAEKRIAFSCLKNKIQLKYIPQNELLSFNNKKMDKIYIESVLGIQEEDELKKMVQEIYGLLKNNGELIINETIWKDEITAAERNKINNACKEAFGIIQSNGKYYNKLMWHDLFQECGFSIKTMEEINITQKKSIDRNRSEIRSEIYSKLGKIKSMLSINMRAEMKEYKKGMKKIISGNKQIMVGVLFVLIKK